MMKNLKSVSSRVALAAMLGTMTACATQAPAPASPAPAPEATETRQSPPPPLPMGEIEFPSFHEVTLPNGLQMIVVEKRDLPIANAQLYVRSGSAVVPADRAGLASLTAELLTKGTPARTAQEISEAIEGVGGNLSAAATPDYISVSSSVLSEQLPLAFELLADVSRRPTFPADEVEIARTRFLSALQVELSQPGSLAQRQFLREVYGAQHPYGFAQTPETLRSIGREEIQSFHQDRFRADNALLVVSGDVSAQQAEQLARQYFGDWAGGVTPSPALPQPPAAGEAQITVVHRPGSVQSNIMVGALAIRPDNPDYYPLQVMNKIVGGGTDSRLFQILREDRGWTYGAYSTLSRPRDVGYYMATAEVRTEVTDSALVEMLNQLNRIRDERVTDAEVEAAKSFLTGSFPLRIETAGQIASQVAQTRLLGLPVESLLQYRERIAAVTADDVQRVAREYVRPDRASIIVVGDGPRVLPMLQGIAQIQLLDPTGQPIDPASLEVRASEVSLSAANLSPMTIEYAINVQGNTIGTATYTLRRDGDVWVGSSNTPAMGQQSEVRFTDDFTPVTSTMSVPQAGMNVDLAFADGRVTGSAELPPQMGGSQTYDAEVVAGTLLPSMDTWVMMVADFGPGASYTFPTFAVETGGVTNVTYSVTGTETIEVPAGTFETYRVEITGTAQPLIAFVRADAPHILVRQEVPGAPVSFDLQSISQD